MFWKFGTETWKEYKLPKLTRGSFYLKSFFFLKSFNTVKEWNPKYSGQKFSILGLIYTEKHNGLLIYRTLRLQLLHMCFVSIAATVHVGHYDSIILRSVVETPHVTDNDFLLSKWFYYQYYHTALSSSHLQQTDLYNHPHETVALTW